jgi:hypothetical protein
MGVLPLRSRAAVTDADAEALKSPLGFRRRLVVAPLDGQL